MCLRCVCLVGWAAAIDCRIVLHYGLIEAGIKREGISKIEIVFLSFYWFNDINRVLIILDRFFFSVQVKETVCIIVNDIWCLLIDFHSSFKQFKCLRKLAILI